MTRIKGAFVKLRPPFKFGLSRSVKISPTGYEAELWP